MAQLSKPPKYGSYSRAVMSRKYCVWCLCMYVLFYIHICVRTDFVDFRQFVFLWLLCRITRRQVEVCLWPWYSPVVDWAQSTSWWWWWWLFPRLREFWGECSTTPRLRFFFSFFFFCEVEISSRTLIPLFMTGSVLQWLSELRRLWPNVPWQVAR